MNIDEKVFAQVVADRLKELQTNAFAVEKAAGLPADAIRNALRSEKKAGPTLSRAKQICDALGLELYVGPPRVRDDRPHVMIEGADYATIPRYNAEASAGPGASVEPVEEVDRYAFRRDWLARIGVAPQNAALLKCRGDSMMPLIWDGDLVMIDTSRRAPKVRPDTGRPSTSGDEIYVISDDGETRLKMVSRRREDQIVLYSENTPHFRPEVYAGAEIERLTFVGKVVWWAHTVAA